MKRFFQKFIGDKAFYKLALSVAVPIMLQNGITNFVSLLDNIMVGQVGTEQMSGVAIVNQLMFVFNICVFGVLAGAGIFAAQFYGCKNHKGIRDAFRFKVVSTAIMIVLGLAVFLLMGDDLIQLYLHGEGQQMQNLEAALHYGKQYLTIMLLGMLPFGVEQIYSSTLRECGETVLPMKAGIVAVLVNLVINYFLIFGSFGAPKLGVVGAAIGTVVSRYIQVAIVIIWTHKHKERFPFIVGAYRSMKVPFHLTSKILVKGAPLMINEALWSSGMAMLTQCYSLRGLSVVAGLNIASTIGNVFNVVYIALGSAVSIIVGQLLGAGKMEEAKDTDTKLITFSVFSCFVIGGILVLTAPLFPKLYNTTYEVKELAASFIRVIGICMPMCAFMHAAYFTLRSGGKTLATFIFDSVFMWVVSIPLAYVLSRFSSLPIVPLYFACSAIDIIKCIIGFGLLKKGIWLQNIVGDTDE